jgi:TPR repeat protein
MMRQLLPALLLALMAQPALAGDELEITCDQGDGRACHQLGQMHARVEDDAEASALYLRACELEDWRACGDAGARLLNGWGVTPDSKRGLELMERGCAHGEPYPCWLLGNTLMESESRAQKRRAVRLIEGACRGGVGSACERLAELTALRRVAAENRARRVRELIGEALRYFERACESGDGRACVQLASYHELGVGAAEPDSAEDLRERGCELDTRACELRDPVDPAVRALLQPRRR